MLLPAGGGSELIWDCGFGRGQANCLQSSSHRAWAGSWSTAGQAWAAAGVGCHADHFTAGPAKPRSGGASLHPSSTVLEKRPPRSACTIASQTAGWIFHVGSQTKALGSIFLQK